MPMTFEQIMVTYYREQFRNGLFGLAYQGEDVVIHFWNVPDVPEPSHSEVMALDTPELEHLFEYYNFVDYGTPLISNYVDSVAQERNYANGVSCASYINSTNAAWSSEATAFVAWRDAVYSYVIAQTTLMQDAQRTVPSFQEFKTELPLITWPT